MSINIKTSSHSETKSFLSQRGCIKKEGLANLKMAYACIDGANWYVNELSDEDKIKFWILLAKDILNNVTLALSEIATVYHPLFLDLDGKSKSDFQDKHYLLLGKLAVRLAYTFFPREEDRGVCECIVSTTDTKLDDTNTFYKFGIHLRLNIICSHEGQLYFAENYSNFLKIYQDKVLPPLDTPADEIVDILAINTFDNSNIRVNGTHKASRCKECKTDRKNIKSILNNAGSYEKMSKRAKADLLKEFNQKVAKCEGCQGKEFEYKCSTYKVACVINSRCEVDEEKTHRFRNIDNIEDMVDMLKSTSIRSTETSISPGFTISEDHIKPSQHVISGEGDEKIYRPIRSSKKDENQEWKIVKEYNMNEEGCKELLIYIKSLPTRKTKWSKIYISSISLIKNVKKMNHNICWRVNLDGDESKWCPNKISNNGMHSQSQAYLIFFPNGKMLQKCNSSKEAEAKTDKVTGKSCQSSFSHDLGNIPGYILNYFLKEHDFSKNLINGYIEKEEKDLNSSHDSEDQSNNLDYSDEQSMSHQNKRRRLSIDQSSTNDHNSSEDSDDDEEHDDNDMPTIIPRAASKKKISKKNQIFRHHYTYNNHCFYANIPQSTMKPEFLQLANQELIETTLKIENEKMKNPSHSVMLDVNTQHLPKTPSSKISSSTSLNEIGVVPDHMNFLQPIAGSDDAVPIYILNAGIPEPVFRNIDSIYGSRPTLFSVAYWTDAMISKQLLRDETLGLRNVSQKKKEQDEYDKQYQVSSVIYDPDIERKRKTVPIDPEKLNWTKTTSVMHGQLDHMYNISSSRPGGFHPIKCHYDDMLDAPTEQDREMLYDSDDDAPVRIHKRHYKKKEEMEELEKKNKMGEKKKKKSERGERKAEDGEEEEEEDVAEDEESEENKEKLKEKRKGEMYFKLWNNNHESSGSNKKYVGLNSDTNVFDHIDEFKNLLKSEHTPKEIKDMFELHCKDNIIEDVLEEEVENFEGQLSRKRRNMQNPMFMNNNK
jgi:hypothetical protein